MTFFQLFILFLIVQEGYGGDSDHSLPGELLPLSGSLLSSKNSIMSYQSLMSATAKQLLESSEENGERKMCKVKNLKQLKKMTNAQLNGASVFVERYRHTRSYSQ